MVDRDRARAVRGRGAIPCMTLPPARPSSQLDRAAMHDNMPVLLTPKYTRRQDRGAHRKSEARGRWAAKGSDLGESTENVSSIPEFLNWRKTAK